MSYDHVGHLMYEHHCDGLIDAVQKASALAEFPYGHVWWSYEPYYGDVVGRAVWNARFVYREARRLRLIPEEPITVRTLIDLDVQSGEPVGEEA